MLTLRVGDRLLCYTLKRSARRTIGFVISRDGLTITAPMRVAMQTIESAIADKQRWIFEKLDDWVNRETTVAAPMVWDDGATVPFFGQALTLRVEASAAGVRSSKRADIVVDLASATLTLTLPTMQAAANGVMEDQLRSQHIAAALRVWLQAQARLRFAARLQHFAPQMGVRFAAFGLSSARTRWGSCSSNGNIRLNWRLVHFADDVVDYVVIHELAHLREMNHSVRFWAVVASVMPNYAQARAVLKHPPAGSMPTL